ncbi:uncharacterized protein LOC121271116 isoform X2 [Carcharodon carcharias]|uniref:uncharacterized protein LOC121271116 isoform X2 n=1 Tax=Carcharodon carcharias TaxID=13397 RepID=UPI001B7ECA20|nr:uncharacterized protein LOC121271116 isoform X2 [Carcharodon carcharias]
MGIVSVFRSVAIFVGTCVATGTRTLIRCLFQALNRFRNWILSLIRSLLPIFVQFHILDRLSFSWSGAILGLRYKVECYGQGKIHEDILKQMDITICGEDPGIPCILFVYKISRDIEDLRNALRWVEMIRGIQREDICTMILLEKDSNKQEKPIEVDHQGEAWQEEANHNMDQSPTGNLPVQQLEMLLLAHQFCPIML